MSRCSWALLLLMSVASPARAGLVNISYWNWAEKMKFTDGSTTMEAPAIFAGVGLEFEQVLSKKSVGWAWSAAYITGTATGGSSSGSPQYFASYQKFNAFAFKLNRYRRLYQRVYLEAGPFIMYRPFAWPTDGLTTAESGSQFNFGASVVLRMRLTPKWDFCQSVGTLMTNASTIWSLGFGHRF